MSEQTKLLNNKILIMAALLSGIVSAAYACPDLGHSLSYSLCRQISLAGVPGILIAAVVSMVLLGGAHGGGPLAMLLIISAPINFLLYVGLAVAGRAVWKMLKKRSDGAS
jgi:branched-subunit amino acid ABC-type transport system permease component